MSQEKTAEKATQPGNCYLCGGLIYVNDTIVRSHLGETPVAAHLDCETKLADFQDRYR